MNPGLPSLAMFLYNRWPRGLLPKFNRQLLLCDNNKSNLTTGIETTQPSQDLDAHKNILFLPRWSTVAGHREDGGPWTHMTVIGHGTDDHSVVVTVRVTKLAVQSPTKRYIKPTNISAEGYFWNQVAKANQTMAADRLNEVINYFHAAP